MAFFVDDTSGQYFGVFCFSDDSGRYSGRVHRLTKQKSDLLFRLYCFEFAISLAVFICQVVAFFKACNGVVISNDYWIISSITNAIAIVPVAIFILLFARVRAVINNRVIHCLRGRSNIVYLTVALVSINCALMFQLATHLGEPIAFPIWYKAGLGLIAALSISRIRL